MYYNYNAIFGRGVTNYFNAVIHPGYLCMKLPTTKDIVAVYGNQDNATAAKGIATLGQRNMHNLSKEKEKEKEKEKKRTSKKNPRTMNQKNHHGPSQLRKPKKFYQTV
jgi:hypothetical protein